MTVPPFETLASVDLGSNSFRLQIVRVMDGQIYPLDTLKETVRIGAGLDDNNVLDELIQERALACLARFGERLRGFRPDRVRVVGTNTLRVACNVQHFITRAEQLLGFPIEIVAGREEARLIYMGAAHSLPNSREKRFVVDIGGGSTEFIIGLGFKPLKTESLNLGCVSYSGRYFPEGRMSRAAFKDAEFAARLDVQRIAQDYASAHWTVAIGTSGTARSLRDILEQNSYTNADITYPGMLRLKEELIRAGQMSALQLAGLRGDRAPVLPGGLAIMLAVFQELKIEQMQVTLGALRDGILYDLLGRQDARDLRAGTVTQFQRRYHIDVAQAARVNHLAERFYSALEGEIVGSETARQLGWAAQLHEIGLDIAHSAYHKHSAYILQHADMPGFSQREQERLATLTLAHKGTLAKVLPQVTENALWSAILALRLAVVFCRSRQHVELPGQLSLTRTVGVYTLVVCKEWLQHNPLTASALQQEMAAWKVVEMKMVLRHT